MTETASRTAAVVGTTDEQAAGEAARCSSPSRFRATRAAGSATMRSTKGLHGPIDPPDLKGFYGRPRRAR
jgi:hypothetical protein